MDRTRTSVGDTMPLRRHLPVTLTVLLAVSCAKPLLAPTALAGTSATSVAIGGVVRLDASASVDQNSPPLALGYAWRFTALPTGSQAKLNDPALVAPSFTADAPGEYVVELIVWNAKRASAPATLTITAGPCGSNAPTATVKATPQSPAPGQPVLLTAEISDGDLDPACGLVQTFGYAWSLVTSPGGSHATLAGATAAQPWFVADLPGAYAVSLVVTDSAGRSSAPVTASFTASACGTHAPEVALLSASPAAPGVGAIVQLGAAATDADEAGPCALPQPRTAAYRLTRLPAGSQASLNQPGAWNPSFTVDVAGAYEVELVVTDATGRSSAPARLVITASTCGGAPPTASAPTASPAAPNSGQLVALSTTAADADNSPPCNAGQPLALAWSLTSVPAGSRAALNGASLASPSFVPDVPGAYVVQVRVTDSTGRSALSSATSVTAAVCGSAAPSATLFATTRTPAVGQGVGLSASVRDTDGDAPCGLAQTFTRAWSFDAVPAGSRALLTGATGTQPAFVPDVPGTYAVSLVVTDSTGRASAPATLTVTATSCGTTPPVLTGLSPVSGAVGQPLTFAATVTDPDNAAGCQAGLGALQTLSVKWTLTASPPGAIAGLVRADAVDAALVPDVAGSWVATLTATDSTGRSSAASVSLTVSPCGGNVPAATVLAGAGSAVGQPATLSGLVTDTDNGVACQVLLKRPQALSALWRVTSAPGASVAQLAHPDALAPGFVPDVPGTYAFALTATDSTGRTSTGLGSFVVGLCGANAPSASIAGAAAVALPPGPGATAVISLDGAASADADNAPPCSSSPAQVLTWSWELLAAPAGAQLNGGLSPGPSAQAVWVRTDTQGAYTFRLRVTDSTGRTSAPALRTVTVN